VSVKALNWNRIAGLDFKSDNHELDQKIFSGISTKGAKDNNAS